MIHVINMLIGGLVALLYFAHTNRNYLPNRFPKVALFRMAVTKAGFEFPFAGDQVIYVWPWVEAETRRKHGMFISLGLTGNGMLGVAAFHTLEELKLELERAAEFNKAIAALAEQYQKSLEAAEAEKGEPGKN